MDGAGVCVNGVHGGSVDSEGILEDEYDANVMAYSLTTGLPLHFAYRGQQGGSVTDPTTVNTLCISSTPHQKAHHAFLKRGHLLTTTITTHHHHHLYDTVSSVPNIHDLLVPKRAHIPHQHAIVFFPCTDLHKPAKTTRQNYRHSAWWPNTEHVCLAHLNKIFGRVFAFLFGASSLPSLPRSDLGEAFGRFFQNEHFTQLFGLDDFIIWQSHLTSDLPPPVVSSSPEAK
jgi:hypothetical protein